MPLFRQAARLGRFRGTDRSRPTLAASVVRVGQPVVPSINLLRDRLLESPLRYGDETEIQVPKKPGRKAQSKRCLWVRMTQRSGPSLRSIQAPFRNRGSCRSIYAPGRSESY